jgi:hypothetical protein
MPIYSGNSTVNTSITSNTISSYIPEELNEYSATRNSISPTLMFDFTNLQSIDPRLTFTRAGSATYVNSAGQVTTAAVNTPRFDYNPSTLSCNGLLMEIQLTNLLTYSSAIGGTNWSNFGTAPTLTLNAASAPDGTTTATKSVPGTAVGFYDSVQMFTYTPGSYYTFSVWVKQSGTSYSIIHLQMFDSNAPYSGYPNAWIQITGSGSVLYTSNTGTASNASATVTAYPNGWYRCTLSGIPSSASSTSTSIYAVIRPSLVNGDNNKGSGGDGTSGYLYWGAQVEQNPNASSYIPTTASTATRGADKLSLSSAYIGSYLNSSAPGTVASSTLFNPVPSAYMGHVLWAITDASGNNLIQLYNQIGQQSAFVTATASGTSILNSTLGSKTIVNGVSFKYAIRWTTGGVFTDAASGSLGGTATRTLPTGFTTLNLGNDGNYNQIAGWLQKWTYYPVALSNNELISLTS